jgi:hypothetical protein
MNDPCLLLGLSPGETCLSLIREAYKRKAKLCHPDRPGGSTEQFQNVQQAYEHLCQNWALPSIRWYTWTASSSLGNTPPHGIVVGESYCIAAHAAKAYGFQSSAIYTTLNNDYHRDECVRIHRKEWPELDVSPRVSHVYLLSAYGLDIFLAGRTFKGEKRRQIDPQHHPAYNAWKETAIQDRTSLSLVTTSFSSLAREDVIQYCIKLDAKEWDQLCQEVNQARTLIFHPVVKRKRKSQ